MRKSERVRAILAFFFWPALPTWSLSKVTLEVMRRRKKKKKEGDLFILMKNFSACRSVVLHENTLAMFFIIKSSAPQKDTLTNTCHRNRNTAYISWFCRFRRSEDRRWCLFGTRGHLLSDGFTVEPGAENRKFSLGNFRKKYLYWVWYYS